ncbi:MAG: thiamine pyrophosphate-dependent enzyme [Phycisphaerales bacterium]|jgi:2-oxoglutarate ferredoxin oxidoreductase subunit beta
MDAQNYDMGDIDIAWCPGCGDFGILKVLKQALAELDITPENLVMVSGIGQAAKIPHYLRCNFFNGLHGRALPAATAIKAANPALVVIAESGDGDMYGEGGNHFIHTIRRNPDITNIIHNNMVYGLTKGQASPTSQRGFVTPVQVTGVFLEPFNPLAVAIALDASFVARAFIGDQDQTKELIKKAITHKGYALLDTFQPCVSFNKINTNKWFKERTYYLDDSHDVHDRGAAFAKACETEKLPLGVFYINEQKESFEDSLVAYESDDRPLYKRQPDLEKLQKLISSF